MVITDESISQLLGARARIASPTKFTSMPAESVESRTLKNVFVRWLVQAPVGEEAGYQLGRNSTDDLGRRRVKREAGLTSFKTLPSSSAGGGSGGEGGTPVGDQIDRLARAIVLRPSEMANASDSPITRYYRLYNRCSSKHLRIAGRHVDTLAMPGDIYSRSIT